MSMFGGYSAALGAPATSSPIASNRETTSTVHANSTQFLGGGSASNILYTCVAAILIAAALLVAGRFVLKNVRIA